METRKRSTSQIIEQHIKKWEYEKSISKEKKRVNAPVVSISREPGSGGRIIADKLSGKLGFDLFHQEVVHDMAKDANISMRFLETLDERALTTLDNWIASLVDKRYLWPDQYLHHLMKVIAAIGRHGASVIVGRGANFILSPEIRISVCLPAGPRNRAVPKRRIVLAKTVTIAGASVAGWAGLRQVPAGHNAVLDWREDTRSSDCVAAVACAAIHIIAGRHSTPVTASGSIAKGARSTRTIITGHVLMSGKIGVVAALVHDT